MSIRQMNLVLYNLPEPVHGGEFQVLVYLADKADDQGEHIYPSVEWLADTSDLTVSYVRLTLQRLVRKGWLERARYNGRPGFRLTLPTRPTDAIRRSHKRDQEIASPRALARSGDRKNAIRRSHKRDQEIAKNVEAVTVTTTASASSGAEERGDPSVIHPDPPSTYALTPELVPAEGVRARSGAGPHAEPRARPPLPAKAGPPRGIFFHGSCGVPLQRFLVDREFVPALVNELHVPPAQAEMLLLTWCTDLDTRSRGTAVGAGDPLTWWRQAFAAWRGRPLGIVKTTVGQRNRQALERRLAQGHW